jgi:3-dehydroquinate synthase
VRQAQRSLERSGIVAHAYSIPPGEMSKSLEMAGHIYRWLAEKKAERKHAIVAIGGGVVGDLAGFVAATFVRGMPLVQVPTSLLAMVDASIGGKVAVNLPEAKNMVGTFYQPVMVLADVATLSTLGKRELAEGWAEAIKHGLILDADLFQTFETHVEELLSLDRELATQVIKLSMDIKAKIVSQDERETLDRRTLLNYGHTIGHALEAVTGYGQYLHGEAVAVGMMGASYIGHAIGLTPGKVVERQRSVLERFGLPVSARGVDIHRLLETVTRDKKVEGGQLRWVLLEDIGKAVIRKDVPMDVVMKALKRLTS